MQRPEGTARRTGYVVKVYPRFSETFVVTEILAREAAGETLEIFALRPTTDTRFHPELARVQAPVSFVPRAHKLVEAWTALAEAIATVPGFAARYAGLLPELTRYDAGEVHQAVCLATAAVQAGITHLHAHFASLAGRTADLAAQLAGISFSVTAHAKDLFHESVDPQRLGLMVDRAQHIVTISRFNLDHLAAAYSEHRGKFTLLYNGLELARFPYRDPAAPRGPLKIAAVGRLVEKKGFAQLLDAVALLGARGIDVSVRIAGEGELAAELRGQAAALGLAGTVDFLGARTQAEIRGLLDWADVFTAPCVVGADGNADGLPTVLLEAMAIGVPCIATSVTGIPEAVHAAVAGGPATGVLLEPGDVPALADALADAASAGFARVAVARAARRLIEDRFDSALQARALAALEDRRPLATGRDLDGLRVAYVCLDPGIPVFGTKGASVHVQEIIRALRGRGAVVTLHCARTGDDRPHDLAGLAVVEHPVGKGPALDREAAQLRASAGVAARIADGGTDLVYERYSLFSTVLADLAERGIPGVLEVNAPLVDEQLTHRELHHEEQARAVLRRMAGAATRTVCVSEAVADWVAAHVPAAPVGSIVVVPNGVNTERIRPGTPADGTPIAVFVGTLKPWHGVETLVDAVAVSAGGWSLRIVGDGPQRAALERQAAAHGPDVAARIEFTGAVAPERVAGLLDDAALAVAPYPAATASESYFSPLKIYEYLAAGLPVVGSRVGQVPRIIADGETGVLVAPSDPSALATALDGLAADAPRRAALSATARAEAVEHHDWRQVLERILHGVWPAPPAGTEPEDAADATASSEPTPTRSPSGVPA